MGRSMAAWAPGSPTSPASRYIAATSRLHAPFPRVGVASPYTGPWPLASAVCDVAESNAKPNSVIGLGLIGLKSIKKSYSSDLELLRRRRRYGRGEGARLPARIVIRRRGRSAQDRAAL